MKTLADLQPEAIGISWTEFLRREHERIFATGPELRQQLRATEEARERVVREEQARKVTEKGRKK